MARLISLSELIDRSWEQFRASLREYLSITGWLLVPGLLIIIALLLYPTADVLVFGADLNRTEMAGVILYGLSHSVILPLVTLWTYVVVARFSMSALARSRGDVQKSMREGGSLLLPTLGATVLSGAAVVLGYVGPLVPGFALSIFTTGRFDAGWMIVLRTLLVIAGVAMSAVLAVRWFGLFQFSPMAVVTGDAKIVPSLKASAALVRGRFWSVLLRSLVPKVLFLMLGTAGLWVVSTLVDVAVSLASVSAPAAALRVDTLIFTLLASVIVPIFVTPLLTLVDVHLYRSLKESV